MKIETLSARNFKGIKSISLSFGDITNIFGQNGSGKTSIGDAINYAFFGKDMNDKKTFSIQTLDENNKRIDYLETEVSLTVNHNNQRYELKRIYKQKWTKKKGTPEPEFTGYEEDLFINEVPIKLSEYKMRIDSFIKEDIFKMVTNPEYFNSLPWVDRRNVLIKMAGDLDDYAIAGPNKEYIALLDKLREQNKSMTDYKKEILSKKKTVKEELETIPTRIDEADRGKPEVQDWKDLENQILENQKLIEGIEDLISDQVKADQDKNKEIMEHNSKVLNAGITLQSIEAGLKNEYNKEDQEIDNKIIDLKKFGNRIAIAKKEALDDIHILENRIVDYNSSIQKNEARQAELRTQYADENAKAFEMSEGECKCPTCQREFNEEVLLGKREELEANFNTVKAGKLAKIKAEGITLGNDNKIIKEKIKDAESQIEELNNTADEADLDIEKKRKEIADLEAGKSKEKQSFEDFRDLKPEYQAQLAIIEELKEKTPQKGDNNQIPEYRQKKAEYQAVIDSLKTSLQDKIRIEQIDNRINELREQEKTQVAKLNELEKDEYLIQQFTKEKITTVENTVNEHFKVVKWKMFLQFITGGEEECCEALVNGVPYQDVNTAGKINAGLDIINALSKYFNVNAPAILDNRESCTEIIPVESQIINLIVSPSDKKLRIA